MKYYKGTTKRRKRFSKPKVSSNESQGSSSTEHVKESLVEKTPSQSLTSKKESTKANKRPSSASSLAEKVHGTGRPKRVKTKHLSPKDEPYSKQKASKTLSDSSDINTELKTSSRPKKRSDSSASSRIKTRGSKSRSTSISSTRRLASSQVNNLKSDSSPSNNYKTKATWHGNSHKTVYSKPNPSNKRKAQKSSEISDSAFEDHDGETQLKVQKRELQNSLEISSSTVDFDEVISISEFLQQQVRILKSNFEIEDCPELAVHLQGTKRQHKNHIPRDIIVKTLRKLNNNVEDDLLKTLNRQAQRKLLKQIEEIKTEQGLAGRRKSAKLFSQKESGKSVEQLKKTLGDSMIELENLKGLTERTAWIESMVKGFSKNPLAVEVKYTNELVHKIYQKVKKKGLSKLIQQTPTSKGLLCHKEIVDKLFS